ncbi:nucleotide exchange factor GrpE [Labedaea rhizosphaerae]|uniref:Protein GrpE n=1 Tax=Labedaea rhizosphaerae TaxID=598644 RepID=A0A4R6SMT5_LABRH|nr:nucleotide exchange factor GrpE [Labedaea rhizosphaerae]TDQ05317.1 molecular chaperone GrpE [Labedaea rhizosphaerae]
MTDPVTGGPAAGDEEEPHVVVRDRRRIDPETGEVRPAADQPDDDPVEAVPVEGSDSDAMTEEVGALRKQLDERTADLQRVTAEYANYRKRIDRDREVVVTNAKAQVITQLLPILDDVERAAAHGDLTGAFKSVADKLVNALEQAGLEPFGHEGEPFDPSVHEAVQHDTSPEVSEPTVTGVLRRGYKIGDKLARAALVAVTDVGVAPEPDEPAAENNS